MSLLVMLAVPVHAQTEPAVVADDAAGDVGAPAGDGFQHLDLTALSLSHDTSRVRFTLQYAELPENQRDDARFIVFFQYGTIEYQVQGRYDVTLEGQVGGDGDLQRRPVGGEQWSAVREVEDVKVDLAASQVSFEIQLTDVTDVDGAPLFDGRSLTGFHATSYSAIASQCSQLDPGCVTPAADIRDLMPDTGKSEAVFEISLPASEAIDFALEQPRPVRTSNGEETTYVFESYVINQAPEAKTYEVSIGKQPNLWHTTAVPSAIEVGPGDRARIALVVEVPFNHQHGSRETVPYTVADVSDPDRAVSAELAVDFLDTPQPAGHHNRVYIHSGESGSSLPGEQTRQVPLWMNTLATDDLATGSASQGRLLGANETIGTTGNGFRWCIPLDGGLLIGMQWDATREGSLDFALSSDIPRNGQVTADFWVAQPDDGGQRFGGNCWGGRPAQQVAHGAQALDLASGSQTAVTLPVQVVAEHAFVEQAPGQDLYLSIEYLFDGGPSAAGRDGADLHPGGIADLPLLEYHEPLTDTQEGEVLIHLVGNETLTRNPGAHAMFVFEADEGVDVEDVEVLGVRTDWTTIYEGTSPTEASIVGVSVPGDMPDGMVATYILKATVDGEPQLVRFSVVVDTDQTHSDDLEQLAGLGSEAKKDTPAPGITLVAIVLGFVLVARKPRA